jgi:hypothetical protein
LRVSRSCLLNAAGVAACGAVLLAAPDAARVLSLDGPLGRPVRVLAAENDSWHVPSMRLDMRAVASSSLTIDYPGDGAIFPPEITSPTFIWHDTDAAAKSWRIEVRFTENGKKLKTKSEGEPMTIGEIDPRTISSTNQLPSLTPEQATAHTWKPDDKMWAKIKQDSVRGAVVTVTGLDEKGHELTQSHVAISTSTDPVDGQIFYRDVPLMPAEGQKGIVQPLNPSLVYLINWRLRDIAKPESHIVMHDLHTCGNCHSFSTDGKTMGIDVDGPANDKGLYAIVPVEKQMTIRNQDTVTWNRDMHVGKSRVGFMSQISPDGKYVLSTFAGPDQDIASSYFVKNFKNYGLTGRPARGSRCRARTIRVTCRRTECGVRTASSSCLRAPRPRIHRLREWCCRRRRTIRTSFRSSTACTGFRSTTARAARRSRSRARRTTG